MENCTGENSESWEKHFSYVNLNENHAKFKYYTAIKFFDCLFDYRPAEKDIILQGRIDNGINKIKTEHSIWRPGLSGWLVKHDSSQYF